MKSISLVIISLILSFYANADIINGYESDLRKAEVAVHNLSKLLEIALESGNAEQVHSVKSHYLRAKRTLKHANAYYQVTEELISRLQEIHGYFYLELNTIRNFHDKVTDIYICVKPDNLMQSNQFGTTNVDQVEGDPHTYQSSFGTNTVSVQIRHCSERKMLSLLIHELAHVKYQVPNLLSYLNYYRETYLENPETASLGHMKDDPSNQSVINELAEFRAVNRKKSSQTLVLAKVSNSEDPR